MSVLGAQLGLMMGFFCMGGGYTGFFDVFDVVYDIGGVIIWLVIDYM